MLSFRDAFKALTSYDALRWQERLYGELVRGHVPAVCDIPTGLGKTSVIPVWLIALAVQADGRRSPELPRRLIYIVNRRTVVDQATDVVEGIRQRLCCGNESGTDAQATAEELRQALVRLASVGPDHPIAISTLRGELADNGEWKTDPAHPSIIIGTIDMIGSKLLFSGYGDGFRMRAHHAGLVGQDTLIVHDEAHLTPAFSELLRTIAETQRSAGEPRPLRIMELSATHPRGGNGDVFRLEPEDKDDRIVRDRLDAAKSLYCHQVEAREAIERIAEKAAVHDGQAVKMLIYVRSPEAAREMIGALGKRLGNGKRNHIAILTGTMRGHERDHLVRNNPVYKAMLGQGAPVDSTVYLVSTSAGEVGIDLDADHMVCDLTTLDAMAQRLGRVNRRGGRSATIDVVIENQEPGGKKAKARQEDLVAALKTTVRAIDALPGLQDGGRDASPRALDRLLSAMTEDEKRQAFAPRPKVAPLTDILLDAWSLTSIRQPMPGRPEVAGYLHGLTADPPETHVAWRAEVRLLDQPGVRPDAVRDWFEDCPVEARERLRDRSDRVHAQLQKIAERFGNPRVVVLTERGEADLLPLGDLLGRGKGALTYRTIVLPVEAGGLTQEGLLDPGVAGPAPDVAQAGAQRERWVLLRRGDDWWLTALDAPRPEDDGQSGLAPDLEGCPSLGQAAACTAKRRGMVATRLLPLRVAPDGQEGEVEERYLLLLTRPGEAPSENPEAAGGAQPLLTEHAEQVARYVTRIAEALGLDAHLKQALVMAAKWHDRGKDRRRWQQAIGKAGETPLAKPGPGGMNWRLLGGYRHEFGSLLDAAADPQAADDLALHLIAAHHGRARPHFERDAYDVERHTSQQNQQAAHEVMRRFGRLQQRFGRWGLAWLESLLRSADFLASRQDATANPETHQREAQP